MPTRPILQLGNPRLYDVSARVDDFHPGALTDILRDLHDTMMGFRAAHGCGRAIAAPQIGVFKRIVYMHIDGPTAFINPVIDRMSPDQLTLWDDCMSFPGLLVRVRRPRSCRILYQDERGRPCTLQLRDDLSELLQHEVDHLDGVLATQRAVDAGGFSVAPR